jgi:hypothetical protein
VRLELPVRLNELIGIATYLVAVLQVQMPAQPELIIPDAASALTQQRLRRLRRLVRVMDQAIRIPGTRWTVGLDGLAGLAPVVGDVLTTGAAIYLVDQARRMGVSRPMLFRMYANVAIDFAVGSFPVIGDLFDVAWKANVKNLAMLERHLEEKS